MAGTASKSASSGANVPGEVGVWVFVVGDMLMFGLLFCTFLYYRGQDLELYITSQQALNVAFGAINTLVLLSSSWCMAQAVHAVRADDGRRAARLISLTIGCGLLFVLLKFVEYGDKFSHGLTFFTNDFFMYYYLLTGIHFMHLCVGVGFLLYLRQLAVRGATPSADTMIFEVGGIYWHLVDLLWIIIFPLLYLIR